MADNSASFPRKAPRQERSQSLVDSLFTATSRVLVKFGFERTTTSRIAETAGVSVGSLYQYFPNKNSLVAALVERQVERHAREVETEIEMMKGRTLDEIIPVVVRKIGEIFLARRKFIRAVNVHAMTIGRIDIIVLARKKMREVIRRLLESHRNEIRAVDLDQAVFILVNAVMGVIDASIFDLPDQVTERDLEAQLIELVRRYLK